jgi:hypothetical protein
MNLQLIQLIDEDAEETFVFTYVGKPEDFNGDQEIRRLKKLVEEFPETYEKLGKLINRNSYYFNLPNRSDKYYRYKSIMLDTNILKEEIHHKQRDMMNMHISKIISDQEYECINPIQECISAIETRPKETWTQPLHYYYNQYSTQTSIPETPTRSKDKWNKYMRSYYTKHAQKIIDQKKEYYQKRKEALNEKVDCECGGKYTRQNFHTHEKTKKHQLFIIPK